MANVDWGSIASGFAKGYVSAANKKRKKKEKKDDTFIDQLKEMFNVAPDYSADIEVMDSDFEDKYEEDTSPTILDQPELIANPTVVPTKQSRLLDAIARNEGTYDTGYNTEYNYGKNGSARKPLSEMTLNQVMDYQDTMSGDSTAIGRYQMLRQTMMDEIKHGRYAGDELFTDKLQDDMIVQRMKRMRGYDDWDLGKLSNKDFEHNLSREFASVADPLTGKGYYPGQGAKPLDWSM